MFVNPERAVPTQVYFDAKHYVEQKHIPFFDFFRNCVFGFVKTGDKKGWFTHLVIEPDGTLDCYCNCREADQDEVCGHGFALYLKVLNWPFEKMNLAETFPKDSLIRFIRTIGQSLYGKTLDKETNPSFAYEEGLVDDRIANYWEFLPFGGKITQRDVLALDRAQRLTRTKQESTMIKKGFAPAQVKFEESQLYKICKLLFMVKHGSGLDVSVALEEDHHVRLTIESGGFEILNWHMPIATWLKGVGTDWDYWLPLTGFPVKRNALPILYRIAFNEANDLEIEPFVEVAVNEHVRVADVLIEKVKNLYYHEKVGYFRMQGGLSHFEMEYSDPSLHKVNHQDVKRFLKEHRDTLSGFDRSLIDDTIFGEVVVEHFDKFTLTLKDFQDGVFHYEMKAKLGQNFYDGADLKKLFEGKGRYRKISGQIFDATGYDGVYLKPLYDRESTTLNVADLFRVLTFFRDRIGVNTTELTEEVYESLSNYKMSELPSLEDTKLSLRSYQQTGYEWLYFLKSFGLGGLLCDQMGLGKTHQSMALITAALKKHENARILVVAPASVIYHWADKLKRFCGGVRAVLHHGSERDFEAAMRHYKVIITTYGTLRNDVALFGEELFDLIIFDEIQNLKNKSTKAYQAISKLKALSKIGLTGTPIENHLSELKALMDLVFPGYLGTDPHFKKFFSDPIQLHDSETAKEAMRQLINPFILRRNKSEVLLELPEKTEDLIPVEMCDYQMELYKEVKRGGEKAMANMKKGEAMLHVFTLINKLKQLCNHPALYHGNTDYTAYPCAKFDLCKDMLDEVLASGEKIVIFTQYLGMVEIFKKYLTKKGALFASITGQTRDRAGEQERFQNDPNCKVFIGTVKAAGVGIDLTAATFLMHYDRWWNAAREEQATDRIHRIGQKKAVQIYKFTTRETVEERIDAIISRKAELLNDVVAFDSDQVSKVFGMDELLEILA